MDLNEPSEPLSEAGIFVCSETVDIRVGCSEVELMMEFEMDAEDVRAGLEQAASG